MKTQLFIYLFFIFLFSFSALAITEYPYVGYNDYQTGIGKFNLELTTENWVGVVTGNPEQMPYVSDLDNDGTKELIVIDGTQIKTYHSNLLTPVASVNIRTDNTHRLSNLHIQDIDNDNYNELIIFNMQERAMKIFRFNGTHINLITNSTSTFGVVNDEDSSAIGCLPDDKAMCLLYLQGNLLGFPAASYKRYESFNASGFIERLELGTGADSACVSNIMSIPYGNGALNVGGLYIGQGSFATEDSFWHAVVDINTLGNITVQDEELYEDGDCGFLDDCGFTNHVDTNDCIGRNTLVSPPLVTDLDGFTNTDEIVYAVQIDSNSFKMFILDNNINIEDDHPEVNLGTGQLVSNVIKMNAFSETGANDYCAMGYDNDTNEIDLLCGTREGLGFLRPETIEFHLDGFIAPDIAEQSPYHNIIHPIETDPTRDTAGSNLNEVLTTYGVFSLEGYEHEDADILCTFPSAVSGNNCDLERIWAQYRTQGATVPVNLDGNNLHDILLLTDTNFWYVDDGFQNTHCDAQNCITYDKVCPTYNGIWKQNATITVQIRVQDTDGDNLQARAILYHNKTYKQDDGWTVNMTTGTYHTFVFNANVTTTYDVLRIMARDATDITKEQIIDYPITVANDGLVLGDECSESSRDLIDDDADGDGVTDEYIQGENDAITSTIDTFTENSGLDHTIIWLFIMAVCGFAILYSITQFGSGVSQTTVLAYVGVTIFVEFILLVIGSILGYIGVGIILSIVIVGLIIIGYVVSRLFSGSGTGG